MMLPATPLARAALALAAAYLSLAPAAASPLTAPAPVDLRQRSIYQVLTDRFARGDGLDGDPRAACDPAEKRYCGGTWRGIAQRLEYIQGMGFDTGESEAV
jgi:alpha-amylase